MKIQLFTLFGKLLLAPLSVSADLICKGKRVVGFLKFDVQRYCGNPLMKDSYLRSGTQVIRSNQGESNNRTSVNVIKRVEVQQWVYTVGYRKTNYTVEFEGGSVARVIKGKHAP